MKSLCHLSGHVRKTGKMMDVLIMEKWVYDNQIRLTLFIVHRCTLCDAGPHPKLLHFAVCAPNIACVLVYTPLSDRSREQ